jgi:hypothetical protein
MKHKIVIEIPPYYIDTLASIVMRENMLKSAKNLHTIVANNCDDVFSNNKFYYESKVA